MIPRPAPGLSPVALLLVALSLSIGWGVRGNWGHEFGAMIPGALAALAGSVLAVAVVLAEYGTVRGLWGDTFAGHAAKHIRFGPNATINRPRD